MKSIRVEKMIDEMTLEEKIGQVVICGFHGTTPNDEINTLIKRYHLGNVILFKRNIENPKQLKELTSSLQDMAKIPLLIATDQEGGVVTRLTEPFTVFPGNMATAATGNPKNAYLTGLIMAKEMRAVGINWDLAPVVDVNDLPENPGIGVRSYSDDPGIVAKFALEFVRGLHEGGVTACIKHFPGKGHSAKDAHLEMPVVDRDRKTLESIELLPYKRSIEFGIESIMPSHVYYPALCEKRDLPATLSDAVMGALLKGEMKFEGVVLTDDLEMRGITNVLSASDAAHLSFKAGADVLMICHTFEEQIKVFEKIEEGVRNGKIPMERLNDAVKRVLKLKESIGLLGGKLVIDNEIGSSESLNIAREIAKRSITCIRNSDNLLERIGKSPILLVLPSNATLVKVEEKIGDGVSEIERAFKEHKDIHVESIYVSAKPSFEERQEVISKIQGFKGTILLGTVNAHIISEMKTLLDEVVSRRPRDTTVVALRNPYDCFLPGVRNSIAVYNYTKLSQRIFVEMLLNKEKFVGRLPLIHWRY